MNPGGLRFPEECVRHKILDAVGDLTLLGLPLLGHLEVGKGSHELHHSFMQLLMSRQADWRLWIPSDRPGKRTSALVPDAVVGGGHSLRGSCQWSVVS